MEFLDLQPGEMEMLEGKTKKRQQLRAEKAFARRGLSRLRVLGLG